MLSLQLVYANVLGNKPRQNDVLMASIYPHSLTMHLRFDTADIFPSTVFCLPCHTGTEF